MNYNTIKIFTVTVFLWGAFSHPAIAADTEADSDKRTQPAVGSSTTEWLDMQREGRAAGNLLTIPGAEAGPAYKRYIDSFAIPIPEQLSSEMLGYTTKK
jgi:Protein of unknown function (DUF3613)